MRKNGGRPLAPIEMDGDAVERSPAEEIKNTVRVGRIIMAQGKVEINGEAPLRAKHELA